MLAPNSSFQVGKWKVSQIPQLAESSSVKVRLRINPSMLISVEGAFVTEEWEEDEEVDVKEEEVCIFLNRDLGLPLALWNCCVTASFPVFM